MVNNVLAVILGGGRGSRLFPLTRDRAKPSVPIAGKFRLVDVPISNCLHSGIERIYVLTQFNSVSLNRHIAQTYRFDTYRRGFVQILAAQQTPDNGDWYQGTADAIRHNESYIINPRFPHDYVLILAGDHLYRMDYQKMLEVHVKSQADITVSVIPVYKEVTSGLGILQVDPEGRIIDFVEKPQTDDELLRMLIKKDVFTSRGIEPHGRQYIASMGIYIFNRSALAEAIADKSNDDFGKDILPKSLHTKRVFTYFFDGYWEDIGTIKAFYHANLGLTDISPQFNFYDENAPVYTRRRHLPSTKVNSSSIRSSILSEGSIIDDSEIDRSIIGIRSIISNRSRIYRSVLMGADFYETEAQKKQNRDAGMPNVGIGKNCLVQGAIIDKNARIGENSIIANTEHKDNFDGDNYSIRDGIVIVPKDATIMPGTVV
ncbi:glucose-1-phosphate adenylyltransferase [Candidatus Poribacteria bacterium]|nr:glucose-1-phosphate adenylyltransferase [Candidatus Poribacteria bacterium]